MRLLRIEEDDGFSLVEFFGRNIPPYAILSHTWGADHEEVTFTDLIEGTGKSKAGYCKLTFCGKQAAKDNLQYFWVDTCCIDKTSSAELSEAINSMYAWYERSEVCYAYLTDVQFLEIDELLPEDTSSEFRKSRWFTRGWTLQELLAPKKVEFYCSDWRHIGDKTFLRRSISEITQIDHLCLTYDGIGGYQKAINAYSVAERMSWAARRKTTREEDLAYCLLGIFGINMPLLYGEGRRAFRRLQEEIIRTTDDQSILAWKPTDHGAGQSLMEWPLADSPSDFNWASHHKFTRDMSQTGGTKAPHAMTNKGLSIRVPVLKTLSPSLIVTALDCWQQDAGKVHLLLKGNDNIYCRATSPCSLIYKPIKRFEEFERRAWKQNDTSFTELVSRVQKDVFENDGIAPEATDIFIAPKDVVTLSQRELELPLPDFTMGFFIIFPRGIGRYRLHHWYPKSGLNLQTSTLGLDDRSAGDPLGILVFRDNRAPDNLVAVFLIRHISADFAAKGLGEDNNPKLAVCRVISGFKSGDLSELPRYAMGHGAKSDAWDDFHFDGESVVVIRSALRHMQGYNGDLTVVEILFDAKDYIRERQLHR
jgi:hypothetical protein